MRMSGLLAIGFVVAISLGCTTSYQADDQKLTEPNMTAELDLGESAEAILSKYGKPIYKKRTYGFRREENRRLVLCKRGAVFQGR